MTSNRTVKFEFQVEADDRQLGRFRDALGKINSVTAVSESVLSELRKELVALSQTTVQTENGLQAQIAALRDASRNADLTKSEYTSLRLEVNKLEKEYQQLTTNIVGLDKTYKVATQSAREFTQEQIAAAQRANNLYLNNSGQRSADAANRAQFLAGTSGAANVFPVDPRSQLGFQQRIANLRQEATLVGMGTDEYRKRALAINALEKEYQQLALVEDQGAIDTRSRLRRRQQRREIANVASNVAIGGFFGGFEGLAGSAAGALAGSFLGPGGMLAGAQIGSSVGLGLQQARLGATAVADMVAQLNLAKTALAQVSANQTDYNQKLEFSRQVSTDYSVGLQATIEGYSKVTAAAAANGLTLKETETIYKGMIASGVAFGASQDDLQSIITATVQILSKGKVSAEEVSGQLGERIPGAVARFAQLTGRSLEQLAKDFKDGKVNMKDFFEFAKGGLNDYDKSAKLIGSSPEKAGERLNLALTRMAESYGGFFQSVGAGFQDFATKFINWINSQSQGIKTMVGLLNWAGRENYKFVTNTPAVKAFQSLTSQLSGSSRQRPPEGFAYNPNDPYGVGRSPFVAAPPKKAQDPFANFFADRLSEGNRLFPEFKPTLFNQNTSVPLLGDLTVADDKAAKKAAKAADAAARKAQAEADRATQLQEKLDSEQRRREELLANNAIRLANQVFQHKIDLLRQEYDLRQQLVEATRSTEEAGMTGVARNMQGTINQILSLYDRVKQNRLNDLLDLRLADQRITTERKSAQNTARYADVPQSAVGMATGPGSGVFALTGGRPGSPNAGQSTGAHLDVRWADRRRISAAEADRFLAVNGRAPSSFGVTSGYGPRSLFGRSFHAGIDFGTPEGGRLSLKNGATFAGMMSPSESGGGGLTGIINTPMGQMKVLHLEKILTKPTAGTVPSRTQPGVAQGINRNIVDTGNTDIATADKAALIAKQKQESQLLFQVAEKQAQTLIQNTTTSYRDQTQALQDQLQEFRERNRLQMEGVKPEIIDQQMQLNKLTRDYARESETLNNALKGIGERNKDNASLFDTLTNGLASLTAAYDENRQAQEALNKAQNDKRDIFNFDESAKAGINGYITSIGTLSEAVTGLTQRGFGGLQSSIKELATTGSTDFRAFALNMISDMLDVITQQLVVAQLAQMIRNILGGASGGGGGFQMPPAAFVPTGGYGFANGGVMTPSGPLRLQTYARGGIADRPQMALFGEGSTPEAYVPLPDGRRIPVAMQGGAGGGGGISVSVNVDASGTKAEGNSDRSAAIGKELGNVIEAKIISMKRPGGLLYNGNS